MKIMNWESVEESTPFEKPPVGGYVVRITDVEDVSSREYLNVVYDIAEGPYSGFYSDDFGKNNPWAHRFVRSYKETAKGMFKAFLKRLEESNPRFDVARWQSRCDERELVGLELGIVLQYEDYTNDKGEDKERLQVVGVYASQDIRNGDYKLPERKDSRKDVPAVEPAYYADPAPVSYDPYAQQVPQQPSAPQAGYGEQPPLSVYDDVPFK